MSSGQYLRFAAPALALIICTCTTIFAAEPSMRAAQRRIVSCATDDRECLTMSIGQMAISADTGSALRMLKDLYPKLSSAKLGCFELAVSVGEYVALRGPDFRTLRFTKDSNFCNYGFYQAYARQALKASKDISRAREMCEFIAQSMRDLSPGVSEECYRGIGQSLPFIRADVQGSVLAMVSYAARSCEEMLPEGNARSACISGAFSSVGSAQRSGRLGDTQSIDNPLKLCRHMPSRYFYDCMGNFKRSIFSGTTGLLDLSDTLAHLASRYSDLTTDDRLSVAFTVGYDNAHSMAPNMDYNDMLEKCEDRDISLRDKCVFGAAVGVVKNGVPGEQDTQLLSLCSRAKESLGVSSEVCPGYGALAYMKGFFDPERFASICEDLDIHTGYCDPATP